MLKSSQRSLIALSSLSLWFISSIFQPVCLKTQKSSKVCHVHFSGLRVLKIDLKRLMLLFLDISQLFGFVWIWLTQNTRTQGHGPVLLFWPPSVQGFCSSNWLCSRAYIRSVLWSLRTQGLFRKSNGPFLCFWAYIWSSNMINSNLHKLLTDHKTPVWYSNSQESLRNSYVSVLGFQHICTFKIFPRLKSHKQHPMSVLLSPTAQSS